MLRFRHRLPRTLRDRRGFALPLALLGLVAVSLLLTTTLITSSTEVALSLAQQDGARGLYRADDALESFVAQRAVAMPADQRLVPGATAFELPGGGSYTMQVARLAIGSMTTQGTAISRPETYSLVAQPGSGRGRSVGALLQISREGSSFEVNVQAGLTIGGNVEVTGSSAVSDGRNTDCDSIQKQAPNALQVSDGSTITRSGSAVIEGKADTASYQKSQMVELLLGGRTLAEAAQVASIKFAPGEFSGRVRSHHNGTPHPQTHKYNWGCPAKSDDSCNTVAGNEPNRNYYPMVALDAGGGKIVLEGDHGQGILIIHNGSAEIKGNFVYNGIILVERDLVIQGTGGNNGGVKIEGAVLALGEKSTVQDNLSGNAVVTYNRCILDDARAAANRNVLRSAPQIFRSPTTAWLEVVR